MTPPPPRARVTRTPRQSHSEGPRTVRDEIAGTSQLGTTYVTSLRRAQLHLTLGALAVCGLPLWLLPLLFAVVPGARSVAVHGLPVTWIVLGVLVYPGVVLVARWYTRASERIEADFSDVVSHR